VGTALGRAAQTHQHHQQGLPASAPTGAPTVRVLLGEEAQAAAFRADVGAGLHATPKAIPAKYLYDRHGVELFEQITGLDEYYLSRTEATILAANRDRIAHCADWVMLIELGAGDSPKSRMLLDALLAGGSLRRYVPVDIGETALRRAAFSIAAGYPGLVVDAVIADLERLDHLAWLWDDDLPSMPGARDGTRVVGSRRCLVAFLGSTLGNLFPEQRRGFFARLASVLQPGDGVLVGVDLVKDPARLQAAYADAAGVTAAFTTNLLRRLNRELAADFALDRFEPFARWVAAAEWVELGVQSTVAQRVTIGALGEVVSFHAGEELRTEIAAKFRRAGLAAELRAAGFELAGWWTDPADDFAVALAIAAGATPRGGIGETP